jgi:hypothetical protein
MIALAVPDREQLDVAAPAPDPPVEPRAQITAIAVDGHAEHACVMVAGGGGVEGADLLIKAFGETSIAVADREPDLTHRRSPSMEDGRRRALGAGQGHGCAGFTAA